MANIVITKTTNTVVIIFNDLSVRYKARVRNINRHCLSEALRPFKSDCVQLRLRNNEILLFDCNDIDLIDEAPVSDNMDLATKIAALML